MYLLRSSYIYLLHILLISALDSYQHFDPPTPCSPAPKCMIDKNTVYTLLLKGVTTEVGGFLCLSHATELPVWFCLKSGAERRGVPDRTCIMQRKLRTTQRIYMCSDDEAARAVQQDDTSVCACARGLKNIS